MATAVAPCFVTWNSAVKQLPKEPIASRPTSGIRAAQLSLSSRFSSCCSTACGALVAAGAALLVRAPRRRKVQRNGWGDDVDFFDASVASNVEAAEGLRLITVEAPEEVAEPFQRPGQFVQAKPGPDAKPSFYAISSAPTSGGKLEFLIKAVDSNAWLTGAGAGDVLKLSPAMGKGFDVSCEAWATADVNQVNLFATGSGVAPMRAAIESGALKGKVCRLYYGARSESSMAYADRFDSWRKQGIEVVPVLSQGDEGWTGRRGYVQAVMQEDEERGEGFVLAAKHGAILCGQKEMVEAVRQVYSQLGVPQERTLLNF
eukprot:TRINITY_DN33771_c0_g1_i1.p1 TRINITY_DN33771_c0_g1~~TRINITY_DN33771_c0_g1_i1.p1  ORF type:complete len:325 (-),score=74.57 TRINITY_DN33771_c0_g1_i1:67-1014(-)